MAYLVSCGASVSFKNHQQRNAFKYAQAAAEGRKALAQALAEWGERQKSDEVIVEEEMRKESMRGIPENAEIEPGTPVVLPSPSGKKSPAPLALAAPGPAAATAPQTSPVSKVLALPELKGLDELESEMIRQRIEELRRNQEHEIQVMRREHELEMHRLIQYEKERIAV